MSKIAFEKTYDHPREAVWQAVSNADALAAWLMPNDFEPTVGHRFTFRTDPAPGFDGVVHCEVLEITPPERLRFSWRGGPIDTVVTFTLREDGDRTHFRMEQDGFRGLRAWLVGRLLKAGSRKIYGKLLPEYLSRQGSQGSAGASSSIRRGCGIRASKR